LNRAEQVTLWHVPISHYSEKARWALAHKGVEHERRAPPPGAHMAIAIWLTRGAQKTFPVLQLDGRAIGDSTAIIEALERRWPDPPLYPADPADRRRALELEDSFDEELGPQVRLIGFHELRKDPEAMGEVSATMLPPPMRRLPGSDAFARRFAAAFTQLRYRVAADEAAAAARRDVLAGLDRLESELEASGGEYLAGDRFSVADLTAAALLYPLVAPPEGPQVQPDVGPAGFEEFRASISERPGYRWVAETYRKHRLPVASAAAGATTA
jgi:glutathione S-transferase